MWHNIFINLAGGEMAGGTASSCSPKSGAILEPSSYQRIRRCHSEVDNAPAHHQCRRGLRRKDLNKKSISAWHAANFASASAAEVAK